MDPLRTYCWVVDNSWSKDNGVEAMIPHYILFCPPVLFSSVTKKEVLPGGFLWKMNGYSKYVCCISAPRVMNEYYLNQFFGSYKLFNLMCISIALDNLVEMN